ncbi:hypothetical protein K438DRAFT_321039 [Mycena galopus ATCC 62051]|nr:hypothetical protein K438DRAFT_321039 [Mycena galopus ATCC 62051]
MDPWTQSLRASSGRDSNVRLNASSSSSKSRTMKISPVAPAAAVRLRTMSASNPSPKVKKSVGAVAPASESPGKRISATVRLRTVSASNPTMKTNAGGVTLSSESKPLVIDSVGKCSNSCCDESLERPAKFAQLRAKAIMESRMKYCVDALEAARIMDDDILPAQALYTSCEKELTRLKCMLAARPPPGYKAPGKSKSCMHPCCSPGFCPPPGSSLRLRHVAEQLRRMCRELSQYLDTKRSLASPIRRLPPELLQEVFLFAAMSDTYALSAASKYQNAATLRKAVGAIRLAHVCSYWRTIALDTGRLWATILLRLTRISGIKQLNFHTSHAKSTPLTILCHEWAPPRVLAKLARRSHRWRNLTLHVDSDFKEINDIYQKVPLLRSLCLTTEEINARSTTDVFRDAPSLRRVVLTADSYSPFQPFGFILPWSQLMFLTLKPLPFSLFSEFLRQCPQLVYFNVGFDWQNQGMEMGRTTETHNSLRKLVVRGGRCLDAILPHSFPSLLSLSIEMSNRHPQLFFAFLARSNHLQMLSISDQDFHTREILAGYCSRPPLELLLATPSLRIMHLRNSSWRKAAMVTPRFNTPLAAPPRLYVSLPPVAPRSLAELDVEACTAFEDVTLLEFIKARMERDPSFDPYGIEKARLQFTNIPFDPEAEMDYLNYIS